MNFLETSGNAVATTRDENAPSDDRLLGLAFEILGIVDILENVLGAV